jgi:putative transposase
MPAWWIPDSERDRIVAVLCEPRFCDLAPAQIYHQLLDDGAYVCSIRQMYRLLNEKGLVRDRRRGHERSPGYGAPQVHATRPNMAWSWDISRLAGPQPRVYFFLYLIIDVYSRKIVGWSIDTVESDKLARRLINTTAKREAINADELVLHSDRGAQMTSLTVADLLEKLGVTRSLSRPRVSNDNPYSEAAFKTVKYRPDYPKRFTDIATARAWMRKFTTWYNADHYHSGIGYHHPADVHNGTAPTTVAKRQAVLDAAYHTKPDRFRNKPPAAPALPTEAWINKPTIHTTP